MTKPEGELSGFLLNTNKLSLIGKGVHIEVLFNNSPCYTQKMIRYEPQLWTPRVKIVSNRLD